MDDCEDSEAERDFAAIDAIRATFANVPEDELEREVAKAVHEVRLEVREERRMRSAALRPPAPPCEPL